MYYFREVCMRVGRNFSCFSSSVEGEFGNFLAALACMRCAVISYKLLFMGCLCVVTEFSCY